MAECGADVAGAAVMVFAVVLIFMRDRLRISVCSRMPAARRGRRRRRLP